jgi:rsbT co-antagonist protein RsbR
VRLTQRTVTLGLFVLLAVIIALMVAVQLTSTTTSSDFAATLSTLLATLALGVGYWKGWEPARYLLLAFMTVAAGFFTKADNVSVGAVVPAALGGILATTPWIVGSAFTTYAILLARSGGQGLLADPFTVLGFLLLIGAIVLGRLITESALREARANARRADEARTIAEAQAAALAEANRTQTEQIAQQNRLLDLVATLETATVPLAEGVLFVPIAGLLDARRSEVLTARLLHEAHRQRARLVVLDIAGVSLVDAEVARSLLRTAQALQLLGCEVTLSGISAAVANTLVNLDVDLGGIATVSTPQEALAHGFRTPPKLY